ncbi:MAG: ABC transporter ATP-binding protein [Candidatus Thiodiazotropha sp. (ex Epidulcina cf. delphinae)]|nr:ABC transporter ATP-binding protein [Candidatus Thiodiazotropha sp. (ex Epidulcina cf. delphinae)]
MSSLTLKQFHSPLLAPFDLHLPAGECTTLSGPSGCGKTRLLRAVADLDPHQGEAWLDEREKQTFSGPEWRHHVGLLLAESAWWSERVGDHFNTIDQDLLTDLDLPVESTAWEISRLSSGERQRLALIRLLTNRPQVLLLDEPTANLDASNIGKVEQLIESWRKKHQTAVLWITHDTAQQKRIGEHHRQIESGQLREL